MPFRILMPFVLLFTFQSCSDQDSKQSSAHEIAEDSAKQMIVNTKGDTLLKNDIAKPDPSAIHIFQKGETLWDLCTKYYGNRHYSSILSIYNNIRDVNRIEPGTEISVPPLNIILTEADFGLVPPLEKEVHKILAARQLYVDVEKMLWEMRQASGWKGKQLLPDDVIANLVKAAGLIDLTILQLSQGKENTNLLPDKMIDNLKSVSRNLKHLASGANDGYGYDLDMVHQDLIRAILNGRAWLKRNEK